MKTEHTPGTWHVAPWDNDTMYVSVQNEVALSQEAICTVHINKTANARLIAAAPDLLKALEGMILTLNNIECDTLGESHGDYKLSEVFDVTFGEARSAIKKARGKSQ